MLPETSVARKEYEGRFAGICRCRYRCAGLILHTCWMRYRRCRGREASRGLPGGQISQVSRAWWDAGVALVAAARSPARFGGHARLPTWSEASR